MSNISNPDATFKTNELTTTWRKPVNDKLVECKSIRVSKCVSRRKTAANAEKQGTPSALCLCAGTHWKSAKSHSEWRYHITRKLGVMTAHSGKSGRSKTRAADFTSAEYARRIRPASTRACSIDAEHALARNQSANAGPAIFRMTQPVVQDRGLGQAGFHYCTAASGPKRNDSHYRMLAALQLERLKQAVAPFATCRCFSDIRPAKDRARSLINVD
jgi:hypothetical protein